MKKLLYILLVVVPVFLSSCDKKDTEVFKGVAQIYFDKFYMNAIKPGTEQADSTEMSIFFYPEGTPMLEVPLIVQLSGEPLISDVRFGLKVVKEGTTANPDEYALDDYYTFRAKDILPG